MPLLCTLKRWLRHLFQKGRGDEILTGISATPDFPDPIALVTWILMSYRHGIDKSACFSLETDQCPFVQLIYDKSTTITVRYLPSLPPEERLKNIGVPIPNGFTLTEWIRHDHFTLAGPMASPDHLAVFLDHLFRHLCQADAIYVMAAWTELARTIRASPPDKATF